jgi:TolB-like protein
VKRISSVLLLLFLITAMPVSSVWSESAVALSGIENAGGDPRYDYLAGIFEGLLLFDLSRAPGIVLVNRRSIEDVLEEQRLALTGLTMEEKSVQIGRLLGADVLIHGSYVFMGGDVLFSLTITDVESGSVRAFSERGTTENALHRLAEKAVAAINGGRVSFTDPDSGRSILSLQDEKPGEILLYSNLVDAEIRLDGEFIAYTTGDSRVPFVITGVRPGTHVVETDLGGDFGIVKLPEVTFHDWSAEVQVSPGGRSILRANERHFNSILYDLQQLFRLSETLYSSDGKNEMSFSNDLSFTDRKGRPFAAGISGEAKFADGKGILNVVYSYEGEEHRFSLDTGNQESSLEKQIGLSSLRLSIESRYTNSCSIIIYVDRTDVYQGLHREEGKQDRGLQ